MHYLTLVLIFWMWTGRFFNDLLEKRQPFLMQVLTLNTSDQFALKIIQRSEERDRAARMEPLELAWIWLVLIGNPGCIRS